MYILFTNPAIFAILNAINLNSKAVPINFSVQSFSAGYKDVETFVNRGRTVLFTWAGDSVNKLPWKRDSGRENEAVLGTEKRSETFVIRPDIRNNSGKGIFVRVWPD